MFHARKKLQAGALLLSLVVMHLSAQTPAPAPDANPPAKKAAPPALPPDVLKELGMSAPEDPAAVERGTKEFVINCAFCHGSSATGGEGGPDLVRSALVMHDEKGDKIGPVILQGRPGRGMPKFPMSQEQIADISAFLRAQVQNRGNRATYEIRNIITGDPHAGEAYFTGAGKCNSCHSPTGDLAGIAKKYDAVMLQSRFLYPKTLTFPGSPKTSSPPLRIKVTVRLSTANRFQARSNTWTSSVCRSMMGAASIIPG